jgi:DNA invertase Pin-like site-specific DNA recombinase
VFKVNTEKDVVKMAKYIEYLRKSQMDRDFENLSVEETLNRHRVILAEFTKSQRLNVEVILEEVVSGESLSSRPQMMKALELINTGEYDGIICMDIDRLSRGNGMDSSYIMSVLQANNCKIITPNKTYDLLNEMDEQFADMKFMFSRYELSTIRKRLITGRDTSVKEGRFMGSNAPYGYKIVKLKGEKGNTLEVVPEEAQVVRMIFDWYTQEGLGAGSIAQKLTEIHISPRNVDEWSTEVVRKILTNEHYIGKLPWKKHVIGRKFVDGQLTKKKYHNKEYEIHDGRHEAIISEEQFELAQQIRQDNRTRPVKVDTQIRNPFGGVLHCGHCGNKMTLTIPSKKNPNAKPRFKCGKSKRCGCKSHFSEEVEKVIVSEMKEWLAGYIIQLELNDHHKDDGMEMSLEMLKNRLEELFDQQDSICELHEKKEYSDRLFQRRNAAIEAEIDQVESEIKDLEQKLSERKEEADVQSSIIPTSQYLLDNYDDLTPKEKNDIWKLILHKIDYVKTERGKEFNITIYPKLSHKPL